MDPRNQERPIQPITVSVKLLGRITAVIEGHELRMTGRHAQALLALLALRPRPRSREAVATDLWPDADAGCTASLRQALWLLRGSLSGAGVDPDRIIEADQDSIGIRPTAALDVDAHRFERLVRCQPAEPEEALRLYRGDLAEGLGHECFAGDRERLSDAYEDALALVASSRLAGDNLEGARFAAEELIARDQIREEGHEILIRVYGAMGSRAQVLRQFRRLTTILDEEIGVEPLPETMAAYRQALDQTVERSRRRVAGQVFGRHIGMVAFPT
jgi:DNA-binding SARP family transcriptional activator